MIATKNVLLPFALSLFCQFILLWNPLTRRFGQYLIGFIIGFCVAALLVMMWMYVRKKSLSSSQLIIGAIFLPYVCSVFGYLGVIVHGIVLHGKFTDTSFFETVISTFLFPYAAVQGWWLTLLLLGWVLIFELLRDKVSGSNKFG